MDEKVRQGWPAGHAPYGYVNVAGNREEPVRPHPEQAAAVVRVFELYSRGNMTFEKLADVLETEGRLYQASRPKFHRTALSCILNSHFYMGEMREQRPGGRSSCGALAC